MIKMEEKGDKIYIYVKDESSEVKEAEWIVVVDKTEFDWCVKKKQEAGFIDPKGSALVDYALTDECFVPRRKTPRERALRLFRIVLEEAKGDVEVLKELKDIIDDYLSGEG